MGTITGRFHLNPLKTASGVAETRLTAEKLFKGHKSSKNQSSKTLIKYARLQVMGTITRKFHQNPLKTVGGVAETRMCLWTDGQTKNYSPFELRRGTMKPQQRYSLGTTSNNYRGLTPVLRRLNLHPHLPPRFTQFSWLVGTREGLLAHQCVLIGNN